MSKAHWQCYSLTTVVVSLQTVFRFSYFSLTEPPKTDILYVYTVCVHIRNHGMVECNYFLFLPNRKGLVCCEINQRFIKLCSGEAYWTIPCLYSSLLTLQSNSSLRKLIPERIANVDSKQQLLRSFCWKDSHGYACVCYSSD